MGLLEVVYQISPGPPSPPLRLREEARSSDSRVSRKSRSVARWRGVEAGEEERSVEEWGRRLEEGMGLKDSRRKKFWEKKREREKRKVSSSLDAFENRKGKVSTHLHSRARQLT